MPFDNINLPGGGALKCFQCHVQASRAPHTAAATKSTYPLRCLSFHAIWWFRAAAFSVQALEIHFWEVPCSTCHVHRTPWKSAKACICPEGLCTLKIGCIQPEPFSRYCFLTELCADRHKKYPTNVSPKKKSPEYGEIQCWRIWIISNVLLRFWIMLPKCLENIKCYFQYDFSCNRSRQKQRNTGSERIGNS